MTGNLIMLILGAILIIEGLPLLISPGRIKKLYKLLEETDSGTLRIISLIMILAGLIIVYLYRSKICP
ncbi:MAG: DUF2065 domain-containing protein [Acidobacteriota bacterium]